MKLRRIVAIALALAVLAGGSQAALAGKKKKGPKPYESEVVTIQTGHPAFWGQSGTLVTITGQEFFASCAIPNSNGFDAYVFEVPKDYVGIDAAIGVEGHTATPAGYDLDIYLFDEACAPTAFFNSTNFDETGIVPAGTAFIVLHNYTGGPTDAQFNLAPYK